MKLLRNGHTFQSHLDMADILNNPNSPNQNSTTNERLTNQKTTLKTIHNSDLFQSNGRLKNEKL